MIYRRMLRLISVDLNNVQSTTWMFNLFMFPPVSTEILMDSTTATAELGWTVYPVSGTSDSSVSLPNVSLF